MGVVLEQKKGFCITGAMQLKDGFLFSIAPNDYEKDVLLMDPFVKVSFSGIFSEYSPVMDPDDFKYALLNPIKVKDYE